MASSRSESASFAPARWTQLNIPLKIRAKCHSQYRYFIVFPLIRVSGVAGSLLFGWLRQWRGRQHASHDASVSEWSVFTFFCTHFSSTQQEMNYPGNGFGSGAPSFRVFFFSRVEFDRRHIGWSGPTARWRATERLPLENLKRRMRLWATEKQCICVLCVCVFSC